MKKTKISTLIIIGQFILLLVGAGYLAVVLIRNYCLKMEAKRYASTTGIVDAIRCFAHGHVWLYEMKQYQHDADDAGKVPTDGEIESAGKMEGQFQIYYFLVDKNFPYGHLEIQQAYIDSFNQRMHLFVSHPDWFDKNGERIPSHQADIPTSHSTTSDLNPP